MNNLKTLLFQRYRIVLLLIISMIFCIVLLMIRMKITHSFFYLFLVWNLFLAIIPYVITTYLISKPKLNKFLFALMFTIWLLFLPNSPYIITDLLHLRLSPLDILWLDVLIVISFAMNGLVLCFLSILDMELLLRKYFSSKKVIFIVIAIFFLVGFGIYLGRFLRFNSWDILQHPFALLKDILQIIYQPNHHLNALLFSFSFGTFLSIGFYLFKEKHSVHNI